MIVGIDVHKHTHAAALIDERGGLIDALSIANSPKGYRQLIDWLVDQQAAAAVVGVESPGSYGRCLVAALAGAGFACSRSRPGARIASVIAAARARPIRVTRCRSPRSS